ncbi:MAG: hypothetical protein KGI78_01035 [Patescibacteria group bacterium]|nr:hypothetical protein [Patescibacteria group bacterium]MDE1943895.1 hypothetical protein [Patescibacteria group bacterium]MDE1945187.1 hypothetical protein [Patescibacteria group bacterium]MDE2057420.1 hypothetical protein [Patescibacteria group bacterium]
MEQKAKVTPKDFFLWVGATIALYGSVIAFISLLFSYLDYAFPDALTYYTSDPYAAGVSYEMASLIVLGVVYAALSHFIRRDIERDPSRAQVWVRRWAIYLTLFLAGAVATADLITLLMYFFNGDTTLRFLLKVAVVLLVALGVFLHHAADLRGYWQRERAKARAVRLADKALVVIAILAGFIIIGTPWQARLYRYDDQKVSDLQMIQSQIIAYWQAKQEVPASLADLADPLSSFTLPKDPQSDASCEYAAKSTVAFELCATFNAATQPGSLYAQSYATTPVYGPGGGTPESWQHGAGRTCFSRTIDPALYPPLSKTAQ